MQQEQQRVKYFVTAYAIGLFLAWPQIIALPFQALFSGHFGRVLTETLAYGLLAIALFPIGLLFFVCPRYTPDTMFLFAFIGYMVYAACLLAARRQRSIALAVFIVLLLVNIVGCHVQHRNFKAMF